MTMLYIALCAATFYGAFCRLVMVDRRTWMPARIAFMSVAAASSFAIFATLFWGYRPDIADVVNQAAFAVMLLVSARRWRSGVPDEYQAVHTAPR